MGMAVLGSVRGQGLTKPFFVHALQALKFYWLVTLLATLAPFVAGPVSYTLAVMEF